MHYLRIILLFALYFVNIYSKNIMANKRLYNSLNIIYNKLINI